MDFQLTPDIKTRIAARMPEGRSVDNLRIITAEATIVSEASPLSMTEHTLIASQLETAGGPPMLTNGVPTIMRIVAWLGHEGINANRLAFVADEMGPAADRIREPNFLLMDFNHSAVLPFSFDQKAIGVWYKAEKRWDPRAKQGQGAYGILAQGIMWAWAFPDYANTMLAEQERDGVLKFSMACLPETVEFARDADGPFEIAHNPVFLTLSALDVAPADKDAEGLGKEGSPDPNLEQELTNQLLAASLNTTHQPAPVASRNDELTEEEMDELKTEIEALKASLEAANTKLTAMAAAENKVTELTARVAELEGQLTEAQTAKDGLVAQATELQQAAEAMTTELEAAKAKLAEIAEKEAQATRVARYAERLKELPEAYVAALTKRTEEEQTKFAAKWTNASDDEWSDFKNEIVSTFSTLKISYQQRTNSEGGPLLNGDAPGGDVAATLASMKK